MTLNPVLQALALRGCCYPGPEHGLLLNVYKVTQTDGWMQHKTLWFKRERVTAQSIHKHLAEALRSDGRGGSSKDQSCIQRVATLHVATDPRASDWLDARNTIVLKCPSQDECVGNEYLNTVHAWNCALQQQAGPHVGRPLGCFRFGKGLQGFLALQHYPPLRLPSGQQLHNLWDLAARPDVLQSVGEHQWKAILFQCIYALLALQPTQHMDAKPDNFVLTEMGSLQAAGKCWLSGDAAGAGQSASASSMSLVPLVTGAGAPLYHYTLYDQEGDLGSWTLDASCPGCVLVDFALSHTPCGGALNPWLGQPSMSDCGITGKTCSAYDLHTLLYPLTRCCAGGRARRPVWAERFLSFVHDLFPGRTLTSVQSDRYGRLNSKAQAALERHYAALKQHPCAAALCHPYFESLAAPAVTALGQKILARWSLKIHGRA